MVKQRLSNVRVADDKSRIADLARKTNQAAVVRVELLDTCIEGGSDVASIFRPDPVVPNHFTCLLSHRAVKIADDDPFVLKERLNVSGAHAVTVYDGTWGE